MRDAETAHRRTTVDIAAELERLSRLHDSGALSDEEFARAKDAALGRAGPRSDAAPTDRDGGSLGPGGRGVCVRGVPRPASSSPHRKARPRARRRGVGGRDVRPGGGPRESGGKKEEEGRAAGALSSKKGRAWMERAPSCVSHVL